jgi:hypothetical protein
MEQPPAQQQQKQSLSRRVFGVTIVNGRNNPEYYPNVLFPRPVLLLSSSSSSSSSLSRDERILTLQNVIVRSLRRRLWKSFQEDDKEMALRAYQATLLEFVQWLQQEEDFRMQSRTKELHRQNQQQQQQQRLPGEKIKVI